MGIRYTGKQRQDIIDSVQDKKIESLEYDENGKYWTLLFDDGSEFSFRFMAELM